jgi:aldose 1-epimerase
MSQLQLDETQINLAQIDDAHSLSADEANGIQFFTLTNKKGTTLIVSDYGAAVVSLFVQDKNGTFEDIVLGYAKAEDYVRDEFYLGTVVGRYANRIASNQIQIEDKKYAISVNKEGYHLHGGFSGFNKKRFDSQLITNENRQCIIFTYQSPHLDEGFPGNLDVQVKYTLDENDNWTVEYEAVTDETTVINLTQHCYFNLTGNLATQVDDHSLQINSKYYLPVNTKQVPTGQLASVQNTPFDFTEFKTIGQDIHQQDTQLLISKGFDHSWVLEDKHTHTLKHAATVKELETGRRLDVFTSEPAIHFYSGNYLSQIKGKKDVMYDQRSGFCLETQHFPDAPNHTHFPSTILKAGEKFYSKTNFKFSVERSTNATSG